MYAYPVASVENIKRVIELSKKSDFIIRLDNLDGAEMINKAAEKEGVTVSYTIIVDSGLHRFGVPVEKVVEFADKLKEMKNLKLQGYLHIPDMFMQQSVKVKFINMWQMSVKLLQKLKNI